MNDNEEKGIRFLPPRHDFFSLDAGALNLMTPGTRPHFEKAEFRQSVLSRIPVGRVGSIHDIAHAVRFLSHPDSGLITGEVLMVDGGWTLA